MPKELTYHQQYHKDNWDILRQKWRAGYSYRKYKSKQIQEMLNENERKVLKFKNFHIYDNERNQTNK